MRDWHLQPFILASVQSQPRERKLAQALNADQNDITKRLLYGAVDFDDLFNHVIEHRNVKTSLTVGVIVFANEAVYQGL